jgi:GNAT superfamily N-acetyltransferase
VSAATPIEPEAPARTELGAASWHVRTARHGDITVIAAAVTELLVELGGTPPPLKALEAATQELLENDEAGAALVVEAETALVGVLAASWQTAIHIPGRYALIQDLWVHPSWRSRAVGAALLAALVDLARERQVGRVEVGLPSERFAGLRATEAFYGANGFASLGPRMRLTLT